MRTSLFVLATLTINTPFAIAGYLDLTNKGSGSFGSGTFIWNDQQSAGTGVIDTFLRIQDKGIEDGFNTNATPPPLDAKGGSHTKAVLVSAFGQVSLNGTPSIRFLLDIDEPSGGGKELLSLDTLQIYVSTTDSIDSLSALQNNAIATKLYDIDTAGACSAVATSPVTAKCDNTISGNGVKLDYSLNPGNGAGDMYFYLPASLFSGYQNKYLYLYSSFGALAGYGSDNGGFEEWARVDNARLLPIPEPTTYAFVLSLVSSAVVLWKKRHSPGSK
jgi:hypothetical protein